MPLERPAMEAAPEIGGRECACRAGLPRFAACRPVPYPFFVSVSAQSSPFSMTATISSISPFVMISGGEMKM